MFTIFYEEKVVSILMLGFLTVSIFLKLMLGMLYGNMIRETDNMATTKNKLLKQCKLKFSNCYKLNNGISNIPVFVDKFLNRLAWGHLSFTSMYHLSGQCMLFSVVCGGIGIYRSIMAGRTVGDILPFYIVSFGGLYLYFSISTVVDVKGKRRILKVNLVDYLDNHLSARMDVTKEDMDRLFGNGSRKTDRRGRTIQGGRRTVELMPINGSTAIAPESPQKNPDIASQAQVSEEELEALLREFLG